MLSATGKKIKNLLIQKNISQKNLSGLTGIKQQVLSDWINGRRNPKTDSLKKIAKALNVSVEYFIENEDNKNDFDKKDIEILKLKNENLSLRNKILKLEKENIELKKPKTTIYNL